MFDIAPSELLIVALVALVVIGPKDLPRVMRVVGQWVGRARGMARHFRSGIDTMIRESELEEMEKKWREENERIMRQYPTVEGTTPADGAPAPAAQLSGPDAPVGEAGPDVPASGETPPVPPPGDDVSNWGRYDPPAPPPAGPDGKRELP
ncbi:MAG TPA: Sec-independent protein translocase protein TatB [Allosphingosinicella sp.]|jgi:sec-independent protein translocase protein TatB